jgi:two-component system, chemotaxis family, sensor kinase CheA
MSESLFDDELIQDYLAECREHLGTIEADLLTIEQGGSSIDEQLVNRVFRAAHSIKGGAGFLGLATIRELAHRTENVLDMIRSHQMVPTADVVSILLLAFDKLRELLEDHRNSNQADITDFTAGLSRLAIERLPEDQKRSVDESVWIRIPGGNQLIAVPAFDWNQARKSLKIVYLIRYDLIHDIQRPGKKPYAVLKRLCEYGTLLEAAFDLDSAGTLDDEPSDSLWFNVVYATGLDTDLIYEILDAPPARTYKLGADAQVGSAAEPLKQEGARPAEAVDAQPAEQAGAGPVIGGPRDGPRQETSSAPPSGAPMHGANAEVGTAAEPPEQRGARPAEAVDAQPAEQTGGPPAASGPLPQREPAATAETPLKAAPSAPAGGAESTIRLNVTLLDSLMTLAGELVLGRNQLSEAVARQDERAIRSGTQRISLVTSELQEVVTLTRMQPVGTVFARFPRLVRDLARDLGKEALLQIEGAEVELDKTILEGLSDPLTHMIRNSVDHGIEPAADRAARRKPRAGTITLRAAHQAGQVIIEVADDGKGLDPEKVAASALAKGVVTAEQLKAMSEREKMALILCPGVSTATQVSDVSGRGVGMDVVKTNLDKLGGKIEIDSVAGRGTSFRIKLPLTLAIIPSLLISQNGERFAIPQVSVRELIRIPAAQTSSRIDRVDDAQVLILRDRMVPLLHLCDALGTARGTSAAAAWNVVLVDTGTLEYGLVVEELHDTVEIVVKPLGRHLKGIPDYAGATILGDGKVAAILDVAGLAARGNLTAGAGKAMARGPAGATGQSGGEEEYSLLLLFRNGPLECCALPIYQISRIERVRPRQIEHVGGRRTMQYRGASLPVLALADVASVERLSESQAWVVVVFEHSGRSMGLLAAEPLDMIESQVVLDGVTLRQKGIAGSAILKKNTTLIVDIPDLVRHACPEAAEAEAAPPEQARDQGNGAPGVLLAEDSSFFRSQLKNLIESIGCRVFAAEDGQEAWEMLDRHADEVGLVTTDIEMPRMDGIALTRRIRADARFRTLPVIAVSTLAGEEEVARGLEAGVTEYQVKLNKDELLKSIRKTVAERAAGAASPRN